MLLGILQAKPQFVGQELVREGEAMLREIQQIEEFATNWWGWEATRVASKPSIPLTDLLQGDAE